jgi:hypothetical protein
MIAMHAVDWAIPLGTVRMTCTVLASLSLMSSSPVTAANAIGFLSPLLPHSCSLTLATCPSIGVKVERQFDETSVKPGVIE